MSPRTPIGHDLIEQLGALEAVDAPAKAVAKFVRSAKAPAKANEALSGTWLGHQLHPVLTDLPIGAWVMASALDASAGLGTSASVMTATTVKPELFDSIRAPKRKSRSRVLIAHTSLVT